MGHLNISDLHNPRNICEIFHLKRQVWIVADHIFQGFQEYPGSVELWERLEDGRLLRIQRWLKNSVMLSNGIDYLKN